MATAIKAVITVCLIHLRVKINGEWYPLTDAVAEEVEAMRAEPLVWVLINNLVCNCKRSEI